MVVLVAKGRYRVVPQRLDTAAATQGFRHVHLKEHGGAFKVTPSSKEKGDELLVPKGRTLFVGNVDDQGGRLCRKSIEDRIKRAFSSCGDIVHVRVSAAEGIPTGGAAIPASAVAGRRGAGASRYAHVCFSSSEGLKQALALDELPSGALRKPATQRDAEEGGEDCDGEGDADDRDENGDETCGYAALIQRHRRSFPPRKALQEEVDSAMEIFERDEATEAAERKALLEQPADADGFVTVTYKRKRGRSGNPSEAGAVSTEGAAANKKRKGGRELTDFYRFQMRESRREQLVALRSKFEQDKARVAKMKEQRKFRPF